MSSLDTRKGLILQAIVTDYVHTAEPVGSERLVTFHSLGCKPATVRNEMAEMAEWGYLVQPHTSAGRIPTDRGYRYYVDALMETPAALSPEETRRAQASHAQTLNDVENVLLQTCRILSSLTSYPSLATDPATSVTTVRRIYLSAASPRHVLMVMLLSTGHVEHQLVDMDAVPSESALTMLANHLNLLFANRDLNEISRAAAMQEIPAELAPYVASLRPISVALKKTARVLSEKRVFLEGANQILRQPEFQDVRRLENLLNALEQRGALYQTLSRALVDGSVTILIGAENEFEPMQECSIIMRSYTIEARLAGYIGVFGPTRMNYARAAAAVNLMAQNLSMMLTNLSLA